MIIFKGPPADKKILPIQTDAHFKGLNKSYWCFECDKGFNTDHFHHHSCKGKKCLACHQVVCPDFNFLVMKNLREYICDVIMHFMEMIVISIKWVNSISLKNPSVRPSRNVTSVARLSNITARNGKKNGPTEVTEDLRRSNIDVVGPNVTSVRNLWNFGLTIVTFNRQRKRYVVDDPMRKLWLEWID